MTALILQGRMDSRRLPGKCLLPLEGEPLIFRVMEALGAVCCDIRILACPKNCKTPFGKLAEKAGFVISTGSEDDVLARYCIAIRRYSPDLVIRATADNPFVFADAAETLAMETTTLQADYAGHTGLPYGAGVEVVKAEALLKAERESTEKKEREHVCPYLYNHPELFNLHLPLAPVKWQGSNIRLTVDTHEDYLYAQKLYRLLREETACPERYCGTKILELVRCTLNKTEPFEASQQRFPS
ncbi:MAG: NTP transferase domain-containing protein [Treponema sp.]|nr:NTP transferase domain-containing protein [Treponema sp.]